METPLVTGLGVKFSDLSFTESRRSKGADFSLRSTVVVANAQEGDLEKQQVGGNGRSACGAH